ncbi:hypothetical protein [Frigoribacterium salinisoli]
MNDTNRALNRAFVLVVGLVLLLGGAVVAVGALLPEVQRPVADAAESVTGPTTDALEAQPWILWVAAAVALVLVLLLLWFVLHRGGGRTGELLVVPVEGERRGSGSVVVSTKVAAQAVEEALSEEESLVAVDVVAYDVQGTTVLRVKADARRGSSPTDVRRTVESVVERWDEALGQQTPVVVEIAGGLRTSMASSTRLA